MARSNDRAASCVLLVPGWTENYRQDLLVLVRRRTDGHKSTESSSEVLITREDVQRKLLAILALDPDIDSVDTLGIGSRIVGLSTDWHDGTQLDIIILNVAGNTTMHGHIKK